MTDLNQRRLARLLGDLAGLGVSFTVQDGQIRIMGIDRDAWLNHWLERNQTDLMLLSGCPRRPAEPQTPAVLFEHLRPA